MQKEKRIAYGVFEDSIPYHRVIISDGLGYDDNPWMMLVDLPFSDIRSLDLFVLMLVTRVTKV